jgi:hypothetical protein
MAEATPTYDNACFKQGVLNPGANARGDNDGKQVKFDPGANAPRVDACKRVEVDPRATFIATTMASQSPSSLDPCYCRKRSQSAQR